MSQLQVIGAGNNIYDFCSESNNLFRFGSNWYNFAQKCFRNTRSWSMSSYESGQYMPMDVRSNYVQVLPEPGCHERMERWCQALEGEDAIIASELMEGYKSCVDQPSAGLFKELLAINPDAKVILSVRNSAEEWYASASRTIIKVAALNNTKKQYWDRMQYKWYAAHMPNKKIPETKQEYIVSRVSKFKYCLSLRICTMLGQNM